ncbi:Armadillo/beta-catenin-like repeat/HEAT-like repeat/HEAT repeat/Atypical Arm repeat, putative [Angomonas deanei]|uniref:Importin subunit alpha n=1 Tax=Angomonas deanei TaxID=59799 RepID=A0A7G2C2E5_9TRYP|nr:Armadillo/beta-catenin-like repeat/HEAT-like repeat/HEAT repeat/Atypical Arm repeat, putative [Angomonas deanei]
MFNNQDKKKGAKQATSSGVGIDRRQRQLQQIRSKAHKEKLKLFRKDDEEEEGDQQGMDHTGSITDITQINKDTHPNHISVDLLPTCLELLQASRTEEEVLLAVTVVRKLLCVNMNPPNEQVARMGFPPLLVQLLAVPNEAIQLEAAWAITNLAAGDARYARVVVDAGAVPPLIQMLQSPSDGVRDQAGWALGNLSGDCTEYRDLILQGNGLIGLLSAAMYDGASLSSIRNCSWAVANMFRKKPAVPLEVAIPALSALAHLVYHTDTSVISDSAWSISYIGDGPAERVQAVINAGVMPRMVELLASPAHEIRMPAIRAVGNCAAGEEAQTQLVVNLGVLPHLGNLMADSKRTVRKEVCWTISNIIAGTAEQTEAAVNSGVMVPVVQQALSAPELDVRREACFCVSNLLATRIPSYMEYLLNMSLLPPLANCLRVGDTKILVVALECVEYCLEYGAAVAEATGSTNTVADALYECGAVDSLESLQSHNDVHVYDLALNIIEGYFATEEEMNFAGQQQMMQDFADPNNMNGGGGAFNF